MPPRADLRTVQQRTHLLRAGSKPWLHGKTGVLFYTYWMNCRSPSWAFLFCRELWFKSNLPQIHTISRKNFDSFTLQHHDLHCERFIVLDTDFSLNIDHSVPRKMIFAAHGVKNPYDLPRCSRTSGQSCNLAIRHDPAFWNAANQFNHVTREWFHVQLPNRASSHRFLAIGEQGHQRFDRIGHERWIRMVDFIQGSVSI